MSEDGLELVSSALFTHLTVRPCHRRGITDMTFAVVTRVTDTFCLGFGRTILAVALKLSRKLRRVRIDRTVGTNHRPVILLELAGHAVQTRLVILACVQDLHFPRYTQI